eukprot:9485317-Pyramimonas_sp.AAC.1
MGTRLLNTVAIRGTLNVRFCHASTGIHAALLSRPQKGGGARGGRDAHRNPDGGELHFCHAPTGIRHTCVTLPREGRIK